MSVFLDIPQEQWILETDYFFVIKDKYPVTEGHLLIISKRKAVDFFALNESEQSSLISAINLSKQYVKKSLRWNRLQHWYKLWRVRGSNSFPFSLPFDSQTWRRCWRPKRWSKTRSSRQRLLLRYMKLNTAMAWYSYVNLFLCSWTRYLIKVEFKNFIRCFGWRSKIPSM